MKNISAILYIFEYVKMFLFDFWLEGFWGFGVSYDSF